MLIISFKFGQNKKSQKSVHVHLINKFTFCPYVETVPNISVKLASYSCEILEAKESMEIRVKIKMGFLK